MKNKQGRPAQPENDGTANVKMPRKMIAKLKEIAIMNEIEGGYSAIIRQLVKRYFAKMEGGE